MIRTFLPLAAAAAVLGSAGCASSARYVERTPTGGVVAVPNYQHRGEAVTLIKEHVGSAYAILDEKEVPTGQTVTATTDQKKDESVMVKFLALFSLGGGSEKSTTTTGPVTEYRIWYQKAGSPPAGAPAVPDTVIQTQYLSPSAPPPATGPTSLRNLSPFDGGGCKT